jgi:hypothetical protein
MDSTHVPGKGSQEDAERTSLRDEEECLFIGKFTRHLGFCSPLSQGGGKTNWLWSFQRACSHLLVNNELIDEGGVYFPEKFGSTVDYPSKKGHRAAQLPDGSVAHPPLSPSPSFSISVTVDGLEWSYRNPSAFQNLCRGIGTN